MDALVWVGIAGLLLIGVVDQFRVENASRALMTSEDAAPAASAEGN